MKEKSVIFCFLKLKPKEEIGNFSNMTEGGWLFCEEFRSLFFSKLMFTYSASCWSRNHGLAEK